jgi:hypothetical protein
LRNVAGHKVTINNRVLYVYRALSGGAVRGIEEAKKYATIVPIRGVLGD